MSISTNEQEHAKKRKRFTIFGIILIILGFCCFIGGPIAAFMTRKFYLGFIAFIGVFLLFPGFVLFSLGTMRALSKYTSESVGPVAVNAAHNYGRPIAREMASGIKDGLTGENSEMYCKYCGNLIDEDSEFCKYCGKKQN